MNIFVEYSDPPESPIAIGHINIVGGGLSTVNLVVGKGAFRDDDIQMSSGNAMRCSSWRGLQAPSSGSVFRLYGRLTGDLNGSNTTGFTNVTFMNLDRLSRFDIDGDLNAFFAIGAPADSTFLVWAANFTQLGRVQLDSGDITEIRVFGDIDQPSASAAVSIATGAGNIERIEVGGSLRGDVICRGTHDATDPAEGRIFDIIVGDHIGREYDADDYGDPTSSAQFPELFGNVNNQPVLCIEASNGINLIEADTMTCIVDADRRSFPTPAPDAPGRLESLVTRTGNFKGMIKAQGLKDNDSSTGGALVDIAGDFRGRIKLDEDPGTGPFYGLFKIRGSLLPLTVNSTTLSGFECDTGEFHGQIIVNAADASEAWTSAVKIGGTTLSHTSGVYSTPSAGLGGGAVGLAPFKFYEVDCEPPHGELDIDDGVLFSAFDSGTPVILRWYGPVQLPSGVANPKTLLTIEAQDPRPGNECEWVDLTQIFTVTMHPGGDMRAIGIGSTTLPRESIYRIRYSDYAEGELKFFECVEVDGSPAVAGFPTSLCETQPDAYFFRILPDCNNNYESDYEEIANDPGLDLNEDGFLDDCALGDPCACDFNANMMMDVPDIFDFLSAWFSNNPAADFDHSGTVAVPDIFAFLSCWFANACD